MQKQPPIMLEPQKIATAFDIIKNSSNSKELIKEADTYIRLCEGNPQFALVLMKMFEQVSNNGQKWQILIHLSNVIKRNWTAKRRQSQVILSEQTKNKIKNGLLSLYQTNWNDFYKEFNQIFKFLARFQFPSNYPVLKSFIMQILSSLSNAGIESFMTLKELLPYLSLIKTVFKQSSIRKLSHTRDLYLEHIAQPVHLCYQIFQKINSALGMLKQAQVQGGMNIQLSSRLLECSRKIDKIIMYSLQSMVSTMQTDSEIKHIVQKLVDKLKFLIDLRTKQLNQKIQLNIYGILEGVSKIQGSFPFVFTTFLDKYLQIILYLLISQKFENENLVNCILTANTKPLITFAYYSSQVQFKQSMQCRKGASNSYANQQNICHTVFMSIYGGTNATAFMEKAIVDLMPKYKSAQHQTGDINFEEGDHQENASEYGSFELLLILLKNLMLRFKEQFKPFISKIIDHIFSGNGMTSNEAVANMYEIILLITKVYDEGTLPLERIFNLMQVCYTNGNFAMFSRLIRSYNYYFNFATIRKSFEILVSVMAMPEVDHQILFQCAVCIKKILNEHEEQGLPVDQLGLCLVNLLNLVSIYKGVPSHLWNLLQLVNQILKLINSEAVFVNLEHMIESLNKLVQSNSNDELIVNGISYLLQSVLELTSSELPSESPLGTGKSQLLQRLYEISISLVGRNIYNTKMESHSVLYKLWLSVARCVHISLVSSQLHAKMVNALDTLKYKIFEEDPVLYLELIEQYILSGFISLSPEKVLELYDEILDLVDHDHRDRALMGFYSLYLTYFILTSNFIPKLIISTVEELTRMVDRISQQTNILRTFLMLVINHHLIVIGPRKVFEMLNTVHQNNYRAWFWPYVWSLEYLNHKYACKVASIAMISSLDVLLDANILLPEIECFTPLDKIMKAVSFQVEPVSTVNAATSYVNAFNIIMHSNEKTNKKFGCANNKNIPRKFKTQIKQEWAECDLSKNFQQNFSRILNKIGWNIETIEQRFDKIAASRIIGLLVSSDTP